MKRGTMENVSMRKTATKTKDKEEARLERNEDDCKDEEINETVKVDLAQKIKEWKGDLFESFNTNQHFLQDLEKCGEEIVKCGEEYFEDFDRENLSRRKLKKAWTLWNDIKNTIRDKAEAEIVSKNDTIEEVANLKMDDDNVKGDTKEKTHNPFKDGDGRKKRSWYSIKFTGRKKTMEQLITATKRKRWKKERTARELIDYRNKKRWEKEKNDQFKNDMKLYETEIMKCGQVYLTDFDSNNTKKEVLKKAWELWWELEKKKKEKQVHERFLQDLEAEEEEIMEYGEHTISNFNRETASLETKKEAWEGWKAAQELNESKQYLYIYDSETS